MPLDGSQSGHINIIFERRSYKLDSSPSTSILSASVEDQLLVQPIHDASLNVRYFTHSLNSVNSHDLPVSFDHDNKFFYKRRFA